ncbi:polymer-forming cytoskeletal protein [Variovorax sp. J22R115]|uniref:bactofilin family protein n=1 Tax=Variovorax sp. J22R115 TaxID=3053509 RepID=UPI00257654A2|nr:polymer-forming cytoskeletal protein [Variovorax sp. J22R115]MDM0052486.1 polymer-forming cytoskeletal protein [Variovorax sp. J22R115]
MSTQSPFFGKRARDAEADSGIARPSAEAEPHMDFNPSAAQVANATLAAAMEGGSKLIVGPNIKLKGVEITDCDTLEVEGMVEASMDARVMKIAEQGVFKGSAQFDLVTIHGQFDGSLTVRQVLVIHATGKVTGKVRYSRLVVEEGGQLSGEISVYRTQESPRSPPPVPPPAAVQAPAGPSPARRP